MHFILRACEGDAAQPLLLYSISFLLSPRKCLRAWCSTSEITSHASLFAPSPTSCRQVILTYWAEEPLRLFIGSPEGSLLNHYFFLVVGSMPALLLSFQYKYYTEFLTPCQDLFLVKW